LSLGLVMKVFEPGVPPLVVSIPPPLSLPDRATFRGSSSCRPDEEDDEDDAAADDEAEEEERRFLLLGEASKASDLGGDAMTG
jgi:hypothetical protein